MARNKRRMELDLCVQRELNTMRRPLTKGQAKRQYEKAVEDCSRRLKRR